MKKFLKIFIILALFSVNIVSAKSSIKIKDLNDGGVQIFPNTDSSSYKIYYQWVKFPDKNIKEKEALEKQLASLEEDYAELIKEQQQIEEAEKDLESKNQEVENLQRDKSTIIASYDSKILDLDKKIDQNTAEMNSAIECFNSSTCTSSFGSVEAIQQFYENKQNTYIFDKNNYITQKSSAEQYYNYEIQQLENEISDLQKIIDKKSSNLDAINSLKSRIEEIKNEIIDLAKYDDNKWVVTTNLVIPKPTSSTEDNYVLWVKLQTKEGVVYASLDSKSLVKKNTTTSGDQENNKTIENPETSDYVLKFGVIGLLSLVAISITVKKLKSIKNI